MRDLLRNLYKGRIHPEEKCCPDSEAYREKLRELSAKQQDFLLMLDEKEKEACEAVWEEMTAISALEAEEAYVSGMRLGAKLALELMKE